MITTEKEYLEALFRIQTENAPILAILPSAEKTHIIDLNSRAVSAPEFLSVERDHKSETIYFEVDRFYDYMDLATTICVIQYINAKGNVGIYAAPFYDIYTLASKNKMLIPWCIDGKASEAAGVVEFSIRFYRMDNDGKEYVYNLNTFPVKSKILYGLEVKELDTTGQYDIPNSDYLRLLQELQDLRGDYQIYWEKVE